jgi:hypothetical protein
MSSKALCSTSRLLSVPANPPSASSPAPAALPKSHHHIIDKGNFQYVIVPNVYMGNQAVAREIESLFLQYPPTMVILDISESYYDFLKNRAETNYSPVDMKEITNALQLIKSVRLRLKEIKVLTPEDPSGLSLWDKLTFKTTSTHAFQTIHRKFWTTIAARNGPSFTIGWEYQKAIDLALKRDIPVLCADNPAQNYLDEIAALYPPKFSVRSLIPLMSELGIWLNSLIDSPGEADKENPNPTDIYAEILRDPLLIKEYREKFKKISPSIGKILIEDREERLGNKISQALQFAKEQGLLEGSIGEENNKRTILMVVGVQHVQGLTQRLSAESNNQ